MKLLHIRMIFAILLALTTSAAFSQSKATQIEIYKGEISSAEELSSYLRDTPARENPLNKLSSMGRTIFIEDLVWTDKGLGSINTYPLEIELDYDDAHAILVLFGLKDMTALIFDDLQLSIGVADDNNESGNYPTNSSCPLLENYRCEPPATCTYAHRDYCITCNCGMAIP